MIDSLDECLMVLYDGAEAFEEIKDVVECLLYRLDGVFSLILLVFHL